MKKIIIDFVKKAGFELADKLQFSVVPKGNTGDLAMSFFALTKELKKSPVQIAQEVADILEKADFMEKTEMAGPYLNLFFSTEKFFEQVFCTSIDGSALKDKKVVVEYSGPNTNKPLHLGHMRNHALGLSLVEIFKKAGAEVTPVNIINDRGVHICKSMLAYQNFGEGKTPESVNKKSDHFVGDYYVKFDEESKKDPKLMEDVQKMLIKWEDGNEEVLALWKQMNGWALGGHQKTYARQGVNFVKEYFESETYKNGKEIAEEGLKKGVFQKRDDGAIMIDLTDDGLDEKVVLRADGTAIYLTNDLAVAVQRNEDFTPNEMIWVVADEQNYHFKVLFLCLEKLGILDTKRLFHLGYGLVNLPDGRMKSREGNVVDADNLMDQLHEIAAEKIKESQPDLSGEEVYKIAEQIQNAAWKFYLLRTSPKKSITFDSKKSIDFQGATGPYLQYAGVRIRSILEKAGRGVLQYAPTDLDLSVFTDAEKPLGVKILEWQNVLSRAALEKNPTYIATYLTELAQVWSSFYAENSILKTEDEGLKNARLLLADKVLSILEAGLGCLGIEIPEKM